MLPANLEREIEAAALIRNLQTRVARLETLEDTAVAVGGYALIEEKTPSGVGSVTFSSIPSIYRHLRMFWIAKSDNALEEDTLRIRFNSDSGNNYYYANQQSAGPVASFHTVSSTGAVSAINIGQILTESLSLGADEFGMGILDIPYYTEPNFKMCFSTSGGFMVSRTGLRQSLHYGYWKNSAAIDTLLVDIIAAFDFVSGSKLSLYGLS